MARPPPLSQEPLSCPTSFPTVWSATSLGRAFLYSAELGRRGEAIGEVWSRVQEEERDAREGERRCTRRVVIVPSCEVATVVC
ncbi:hypothetical protein BDA96_10G214200 [Sorghum bicolor]|uniref:Uncharacterized protein n=1 Tax=Sorghum bicolor TaxID=4558 RepID=A0A921Q322_SORBI|nr:hypothetical protein BDA96_10G214200 [Sorghum bicolor]